MIEVYVDLNSNCIVEGKRKSKFPNMEIIVRNKELHFIAATVCEQEI